MGKKYHFFKEIKQLAVKISAILFIIMAVSNPAQATSRLSKISLTLENAVLGDAIALIKEQSDYHFFYEKSIESVKINNVKLSKEEDIDYVLREVLKGTNITYQVVDKIIVLSDKSDPIVEQKPIMAQQRQISGWISDDQGEPLPGVNVRIAGTSIGVVTDFNGKYAIKVPEGSGTLVFSFVGYETKEIEIGNQTEINVQLLEAVTALDEVMVTALGITREKKALGYSVGEVKSESLTRVTQENVINALSGKVSGVQIQNTGGDPGSSVSIVIRGAKSLGSDNQPLFVIDGVPVSNSLGNISSLGAAPVDYGNAINDLNPDDVESVSVLKGPSAAALYGSRAGNGVILITTKSGNTKRKGLGVSINSSVVFDKPSKFLPSQNKYTSGIGSILDEGGDLWLGPQMDIGREYAQWNTNKQKTPLVSYPNKWKDFMGKAGYTIDNNIGVTGNYDKGSFRISFGNLQNTGVVPNTDLTRNTFNLAPVYKIRDNLIVSANVNIAQTKSDNRPAGGDQGSNAMYALEMLPPHINVTDLQDYWRLKGIEQRAYAYKDGVVKSKMDNPYFIANEMTNSFRRNRIFGNVKLDWEIMSGLSVMGRFSMDTYNEGRESRIPMSYSGNANGGFGIEDRNHMETNADFLISYEKSFNDFRLNASVGGNIMHYEGRSIVNRTDKLTIPDLYTIGNADGGPSIYGNGYSEKIIRSIYGMATLSYKYMVYLDLTARNDWSSTLPEDNRSYFYPSASLSFLLNEALGIPTSKNMIKLRLGLAQVGNDTNPYSLYESFGFDTDWGGIKRAYLPPDIKNPRLKPEIATSKEFGADVQLYHNRLGASATYYITNNKNQILNIQDFGPSSGYTSEKINAGMVQSKGWELELHTVPVEMKDLRWDLDFTFTRNRTKIKELTDNMNFYTFYSTDDAFARTYVGEYIGDIWGYAYDKVTDTDSPYYGYPLLRGNDYYGMMPTYSKEDKDMIKIGNFNHKFLMSVSTNVTYKRFTLSALIDWRHGGEFLSVTYKKRYNGARLEETFRGVPYDRNQDLPSQIKANPDKYFGQWVGGIDAESGGLDVLKPTMNYYNLVKDVFPQCGSFIPGVYKDDTTGELIENLGDPATTKYMISAAAGGEMYRFDELYMFDASFIKLREISLTYQLPQQWLQSIYIQRVGVSVFCRNIMLWTANKVGIDPERAFNTTQGVFQQGLEKFNLMPWTISVGAKLNIEF